MNGHDYATAIAVAAFGFLIVFYIDRGNRLPWWSFTLDAIAVAALTGYTLAVDWLVTPGVLTVFAVDFAVQAWARRPVPRAGRHKAVTR